MIRNVVFASVLVLALDVFAQSTTQTIAFQARLLDASGQPLPEAAYRTRFSIYDVAEGGTPLWVENQDILVADGLLTASVGVVEPFPDGLLDGTPSLFLEVAVDTEQNLVDEDDIQSPRTPINAVFVALSAADAEALGGMPASAYATAQALSDFQAQVAADQTETDAALAAKADAEDVFAWETANGPTRLLEPNRGFVANSETELLFVLPESEDLAIGDTIRISGLGLGGWQIQANENQKTIVRSLNLPNPSDQWVARETDRDWTGVAMSADGQRIVAVARNEPIYLSQDFGLTWITRDTPRVWEDVTSSADGQRLAAVVDLGQIYTSDDFGETWTARDSNRVWNTIASSDDGMRLVATADMARLQVSLDAGVTWSSRSNVEEWRGATVTPDGAEALAVALLQSPVRSLGNFETFSTFTTAIDAATAEAYSAIDVSVARRVVAIAARGFGVFVSTDRGVSFSSNVPDQPWLDVAVSRNGETVCAVGQQSFVALDQGDGTFLPETFVDGADDLRSVDVSADGTRLVTAQFGGQIYTYTTLIEATTPGPTGSIRGRQNAAIELQYVGNDTFIPLSFSGEIDAF